MPLQTISERPLSNARDRIVSTVQQPASLDIGRRKTTSTPEPRFDQVNISWEYFQNELEFE